MCLVGLFNRTQFYLNKKNIFWVAGFTTLRLKKLLSDSDTETVGSHHETEKKIGLRGSLLRDPLKIQHISYNFWRRKILLNFFFKHRTVLKNPFWRLKVFFRVVFYSQHFWGQFYVGFLYSFLKKDYLRN